MLPERKRQDGFTILKEVIYEITGDSNLNVVQRDVVVEAMVNGAEIFHGQVNCYFQIDHFEAKISVYWEQAGLRDYKEAGLFGQMSTNFQAVKKLPGGILQITGADAGYAIHINYKS